MAKLDRLFSLLLSLIAWALCVYLFLSVVLRWSVSDDIVKSAAAYGCIGCSVALRQRARK